MRVLLIEDDERLATAITAVLCAAGLGVDRSPDGADGLWRAQELPYDIVVIDIGLPELNGIEVCRRIRDAGCSVPVLLLTGQVDAATEHCGFAAGADDFVRKPFSSRILLARIRAVARRVNTISEKLAAGPLLMDISERHVFVRSEPVALTRREFGVLEALVRHSPDAVSRREVMDCVWGQDAPTDTGIIDVYVAHLRRKIDKAFSVDMIETVPGVGYRVVG